MSAAIHVWRHPRPEGRAGHCVGSRSDLPVHWRRAKRLARRVQARARRERLPHVVWTSPLRRCADVGRWLRRWGWTHRLHADLREIDFGRWEGRPWSAVGPAEMQAWCADFARHAPGGGESLEALLARVAALALPAPALVVAHGGWMLARRWLDAHGDALPEDPAAWPRGPRCGECWTFAAPRA
ncbi:MAG: histidine phosphatase family protein [Pelomonas sp.]|nr:histidine phosphatase family protein [Roseateles sp.]